MWSNFESAISKPVSIYCTELVKFSCVAKIKNRSGSSGPESCITKTSHFNFLLSSLGAFISLSVAEFGIGLLPFSLDHLLIRRIKGHFC